MILILMLSALHKAVMVI